MKKLVGSDHIERIKTLLDGVGIEFNGGGVGVLHAASRWTAREMIEERVSVEGPVIHPGDGGGYDFVKVGNDFFGIVVGEIGINDDAEVGAGFVEIFFREVA